MHSYHSGTLNSTPSLEARIRPGKPSEFLEVRGRAQCVSPWELYPQLSILASVQVKFPKQDARNDRKRN